MKMLGVFVLTLVISPCFTKSLPEEDSVVSVYTTQPSTNGSGAGLDVYKQIANNIAERISTPFYRFFGGARNKTGDKPTTKKPWEAIELLDDPDSTKFKDDNEIQDRDVEELSEDALRRVDKKPEKVTLYNSYLPVKQNLEKNETSNEIDDDFDDLSLDDVEPAGREGPFIYFLELIGSFFQLLWGAFEGLFRPSSSKPEQNN